MYTAKPHQDSRFVVTKEYAELASMILSVL
jgi:hypothetical protein